MTSGPPDSQIASPLMEPNSPTSSIDDLAIETRLRMDRFDVLLLKLDEKRVFIQKQTQALEKQPYSSRIKANLKTLRAEAMKLSTDINTQFRAIPKKEISLFHAVALLYERIAIRLHEACEESVQLESEGKKSIKPPPSDALFEFPDDDDDLDAIDGLVKSATADVADKETKKPDADMGPPEELPPIESHSESPSMFQDQMMAFEEVDQKRLQAERQEEIVKLSQMVVEVAAMFKELQQLVDTQQESLDVIETRVTESKAKAQEGLVQIAIASRYKALGLAMMGGLTGLLIGGPVGALIGTKAAVGLGMGGTFIGVKVGRRIGKAVDSDGAAVAELDPSAPAAPAPSPTVDLLSAHETNKAFATGPSTAPRGSR